VRAFAILTEPANYTLDTIEKIYRPRGIAYCFSHGGSEASNARCDGSVVLDEMPLIQRLRYLWRTLNSYDAFIINSYSERDSQLFVALNLLFFHKPFAIESDTELSIPTNPIKRLAKRLVLPRLFKRVCCYSFPAGRFEHSRNFTHYGMPESRVIVMPMVVDNELYKRTDPPREHALFRFGYVGRLIGLKQIDRIIDALPPGSELLVVGDGEERGALEEEAANKHVIFSGALFGDDKIKAIHSMDCLVLYSTHDQWGYVINEALAAGVPVIVSDGVGCRHELVEGDNPTGLVAKWDDAGDLAAQMSKMVSDKAGWRQMSENAVKRMAKWDYAYYGRQLDKYLEVAAHAS